MCQFIVVLVNRHANKTLILNAILNPYQRLTFQFSGRGTVNVSKFRLQAREDSCSETDRRQGGFTVEATSRLLLKQPDFVHARKC